MSDVKGTIAGQWKSDDSQRAGILERARECCHYASKPWLLPPIGQTANAKLPRAYQSLVGRGLTNMEGRMLLALFPPTQPWYKLEAAAEILYDPTVPPANLQQIEQALFLMELKVVAVLESSKLTSKRGMCRSGFRTRKRMALSQILATGDVLECLTKDYKLKTFRRDQYVTRRDSSGDVLYHIVREKIDPYTLTDKQYAAASINASDMEDKSAAERMVDMYTRVEWNPISELWVIEQEVNGNIVEASEEPITPYFSTPYELSPNEDYGRGFIELNLGDASSYDELEERLLDWAALHSKATPVKDYSSMVRDIDFTKKSGEPITAKVSGGIVQDLGWFGPQSTAQFQVVAMTSERKARDLSAAMLLSSEQMPQKERVTATQVREIAAELEGALGGVYAPIADEQQLPLLRRTLWQMERDHMLDPLPDGFVNVKVLTGIEALSRDIDSSKLMAAIGQISQSPEMMARVNMDVLVDILFRYAGVYEPGLLKSAEQLAEEKRQMMQEAIAAAAAQKGVDVAGNVAENAMTQPQPTGA